MLEAIDTMTIPARPSRIDVSTLAAIDVHVHLEHAGDATATDAQAQAYFKNTASRDPEALADY